MRAFGSTWSKLAAADSLGAISGIGARGARTASPADRRRAGDAETSVNLGAKPQLVGQQVSTGEIYASYQEDLVQRARSFM